MEGVFPGDEFPAPCGSVPVSDDGGPVPDEESSTPCDDFSSSRRLSAFSCSLPWICAAGSPADVAGTTPNELAVDSTPGGDAPSSWDVSSGVSLLCPPRARRSTSYEHRPLSSGCWFSGSGVLLLKSMWGFPVLRMVLTPEFIALTEKMLSPSRYNYDGDANWNTLPSLIDGVSPGSASCRLDYLIATGGDDDLRLLQLIVIVHAVPQPCNQLVVHQVIRRAAVHNHGDHVGVGVKTLSAAACHHPPKRNSLSKSSSKLRDGFSSSLEGGELALSTAADDAM